MIEISSILEVGFQNGLDIEINWICSADDEDMMDEGKEYARLVGMPVNFITE
jgi:hypothetical protein